MRHTILTIKKFTAVLNINTAVNSGIGGNNTANVIRRLSTINSHSANIALLMIGTNDSLNSSAIISPSQYDTNLRSIITSLENNGSEVILMSILPCIESYVNARHTYPDAYPYNSLTLNEVVDLYNSISLSVANDLGLGYIDVNKLFTDAGMRNNITVGSWMRNLANVGVSDGVHPTADGADKIAYLVYTYLANRYNSINKVICIGDSITYGVWLFEKGTANVTAETYPGRLMYYVSQQL